MSEGKNTKKKKRKNSNYRQVYQSVDLDRLCRKTLCDYRNAPAPRQELGESEKVDRNLYETGATFSVSRQASLRRRKRSSSSKGKKPRADEQRSSRGSLRGIPLYQVEKNLFAFKAQKPEDYVRASMIRLALCDIINTIIEGVEDGKELHIDSEEMERAAGYINFASSAGVITEEQGVTIYMQLKQKKMLDFPFISSITGLGTDVLRKMAEA